MVPSSVRLLLLLCSLHLMVLAKPACKLQGKLVQETHRKLLQMGDEFPVQCVPYNANISLSNTTFPGAEARCRQVMGFVHEFLLGAELIFDENEVPNVEGGVSWDAAELDIFLNLLNRLVEESSCAFSGDASGVLSPYFSNVTANIVQQENAACGWMALRRDVRRVLTRALQNHGACFAW